MLVFAPRSAAAELPPENLSVDEFVLSKAKGDAAWSAGRLSDALGPYEKALSLRLDPVITGRLGLIYFDRGDYDLAAQHLYRAVNDTSPSISKEERVRFSRKYADALAEVSRIDMTVDQPGARVEIDGVDLGQGRTAFWIFLEPGEHAVRASLSGYEDTVTTIVAERGIPQQIKLEMHLPQLVKLGVPLLSVVTNGQFEERVTWFSHRLLYAAKLPPNPLEISVSRRFVGGVGVWIPFGVTPGSSVGGQLHAGWRSSSWFEIGAEVGAAWSVGYESFTAGDVYSWKAGLVPCARFWRVFSGCALVQVDGGGLTSKQSNWLAFGAGLRAGVEVGLFERFGLALHGDLVLMTRHPNGVGEADPRSPAFGKNLRIQAFGFYFLTFF